MPFTIATEGMEELYRQLDKLGEKAAGVASLGLYEGAGVVADKVSSAVQGIATEEFHYVKNGTRKPSPEEKALVNNAPKGVAKFRKNGLSVQTSVGIKNGYGAITWNHARSGNRTKYKIGFGGVASSSYSQEGKSSGISAKPVELIANAINSGTSFMQKQPFLRKAFSQSKGAAVSAIENRINEEIEKLTIE